MKTTTECFTDELLRVFEGHHNIDTFSKACGQLAPKYPEFYSDSKPTQVFFGVFENSFRTYLESEMIKLLQVSMESIRDIISRLFDMSLWCCANGFARDTLPFVLMEDIYDLLTLGQVEEVFDIFEARYEKLRKTIKKGSGRFLRANNSLLTRLAQSINTKLKGRVLLFMALCVPLSDKSGLNLKGETNLKNVTEFEEELPDDMDLGTDHNKPIDYKFYRAFWGLQSYFQNPAAVLAAPANFVSFMASSTSVINAFSTSPVHHQDIQEVDSMDVDHKSEDTGVNAKVLDSCPPFFKYLTSTRLLSTQLSDAYFQRHVLVQFVILLHSLNVSHADKLGDNYKSQLDKLKNQVENALQSSREGKEFCRVVQHAMDVEDHWVRWKQNKCEKFDKSPAVIKEFVYTREIEPRDDIDLGLDSLNKLWKLSEDNFDCLSKSRIQPSVKDFVIESLLDEDEDEEEEFKLKNDKKFLWKSCRLISREQLMLFSKMEHSTSKIEKLKAYFSENDKTAIPENNQDSIKSEKDVKEEKNEKMEISQ